MSKVPKPDTAALTVEVLRDGLTACEAGVTRAEAVRLKAAICTGVAMMMRISELVPCGRTSHHLRMRGVRFEMKDKETKPTGMTIMITSSKRDMFPVWRSISANGRTTCAVAAMYEFLKNRKEKLGEDDAVFGGGDGLKALTAEKVASTIRRIAHTAGLSSGEVKRCTTKSMRIGGVTTLTNGGEVPGHVIQKHGRWKSDTWMTIYQKLGKRTDDKLAQGMK